MPDLFHLTPEMNQYFNALPEDLKAVAAQLCNHAE